MKKLHSTLIACLLTVTINAQALSVKLYEITDIKVKNSFKNANGKELNIFQVPADANSIKLSVQVPINDYRK